MPLAMQVKLLRAIQERRVVRVGGETPIQVDVRIICATNQDLRARVEAGTFREDLFYRINVIRLHIPLLRERREDILWFARQFVLEFAEQHGGNKRILSAAAEQALVNYPWPGNLRELRHSIERACVLSSATTLEPSSLFENWPENALEQANAADTLDQYIRDCERGYIQQALQQCHGQIGTTAVHLGISRKNLWEKMKRLQIRSRAPESDEC
jgi:DNA-binding NtrC family response regulator